VTRQSGRPPARGDVYWIDPNPIAGREMRDRNRFVVITPREINAFGVAMTVPVTTGGAAARLKGFTVPIVGHGTTGVAVCNQVRSFDIEARVKAGSARFIERLDATTTDEIVVRVLSLIDPADG
jgi:mRNA interferase ChpB